MRSCWCYWSLCLVLSILHTTEAITINNGVVGDPTIDCGEETIQVWFDTLAPFEGKVFVKGQSEDPQCSRTGGIAEGILDPNGRQDNRPDICPPCPACGDQPPVKTNRFARQIGLPTRRGTLEIRIGTCDARRERRLSPNGVLVSFTAVVSFHPFFITKVDRAYRIQCFYQETEKTVTSQIDVSMPATTELIAQAPMPVCSYSVHRDSPEGPQVRYVKVGEKVFHKWKCDSADGYTEMFGIIVHSCFVNDGQGQRVQIIDDRGCTVDSILLDQVTYTSFMVAYVESHVFKFADRTGLDFQCAIGICITADGGCSGLSPPSCAKSEISPRSRRALPPSNHSTPAQCDVQSPRLTVLDIDSEVPTDELRSLELKRQNSPFIDQLRDYVGGRIVSSLNLDSQEYCLSVAGFGALVALLASVSTAAVVLVTTLYLVNQQQRRKL